jgi:HK97 family phage major capsid protein
MSQATQEQKEHQELAELISEFRNTLESKSAHLSENKEKLAKMESRLDQFEEKNQKLVQELAETKQREDQLKGSMDTLERQLARMPAGSASGKERSEALKAFEKAMKFGTKKLDALELKYLRTDSDPDGGVLAPPEYSVEILKKITEISPIRSLSRVRTTSSSSMLIPVRDQLLSATWVGEADTIASSNSKYGRREVKVNKMAVTVLITIEQLEDSAFNMDAEISADVAEAFAVTEGVAFLTGNGVNKPEGVLSNSSVSVFVSGIANDFTADNLIDLQGQLKTGYNPYFVLNRRTLAKIRKMKDGVGQYLWASGLAAGLPNTIDGIPYISAIDMPDAGVNTTPVLLGDFMRGYTVLDHTSLTMLRDPYSLADKGEVRFVATRRVGGQVVIPEAFKVLKCAIS